MQNPIPSYDAARGAPGTRARPTRLLAAAPAFLLLAFAGCQTARMPLPDTLAGVERMPVSGRWGLMIHERVRFGTFEAPSVDRSWTRGGDVSGESGGTFTGTASQRRQTYRFTLRDGAVDYWFVACHAAVESLRIDLDFVDVTPSDGSTLYCNIQSTTDPLDAWEMQLTERHRQPLSGTISLGDERFEVAGTNAIDRAFASDRPTGYELRHDGTVVGAVEVINSGAVWLIRDLEPDHRRLLAAASTALLLLEDLYDSIDDTHT